MLASGLNGTSATARTVTSTRGPRGRSRASSIAPAPDTLTGSNPTCTGSTSPGESGPIARCTTLSCPKVAAPTGSTPTVTVSVNAGTITVCASTRTTF
ncbi:hypothetical protein C1Y40_05778 [Mycobacterium talmoniae]|uniref:Uncharacterized protein n=1 Tax=Mycobacterium talmoniae TaxID=1858794 RepID=A0A2S8BBN6_9MYCO|nr:hypothetical protein C1Y40_05778 [Mycobacterium talmoniae]